jgi:hypothetical protein
MTESEGGSVEAIGQCSCIALTSRLGRIDERRFQILDLCDLSELLRVRVGRESYFDGAPCALKPLFGDRGGRVGGGSTALFSSGAEEEYEGTVFGGNGLSGQKGYREDGQGCSHMHVMTDGTWFR